MCVRALCPTCAQGFSHEFIDYLQTGQRMKPGPQWPTYLCKLMDKCWLHDPAQRPSFAAIVQELSPKGKAAASCRISCPGVCAVVWGMEVPSFVFAWFVSHAQSHRLTTWPCARQQAAPQRQTKPAHAPLPTACLKVGLLRLALKITTHQKMPAPSALRAWSFSVRTAHCQKYFRMYFCLDSNKTYTHALLRKRQEHTRAMIILLCEVHAVT